MLIEQIGTLRAALGEWPVWDAARGLLWMADCRKGLKPPRQSVWLSRPERGLIAFLGECGSAGDYLGMGFLGGPLWHSLQVTSRTRAERVRLRNVNMRTCMGFKGYRRYGLPESIWKLFNLDANAMRSSSTATLVEYRQKQAKVASGPLPAVAAIAP